MANKKNTETVPNINDVANLKKDFKDRRDYEEEQNQKAQEEYNDKEKELVDKLVNEMSGKKKSRAKEFIKKGAISIVALAALFGFTKFKNWYKNKEPDIIDNTINNLTVDEKEATENSIEDEYGVQDADGNVVSIDEAVSGSGTVKKGTSLDQDHTITEENVNEGIEESTDPSKDTVELVQEQTNTYDPEIEEAKKTSTTTTLNENVTAAAKNETTTTNTTTKDESTKIDTNTETKKVEAEEEKSKTNTTNTVETKEETTSTQNTINQEIDDSELDDLYDLTK